MVFITKETAGKLRPLIVVVEDNPSYQEEIVAALRAAFGDAVDVEVSDTHSVALDILRKNAERVCGVVADVNYYPDLPQPGKSDDTERCGLWMIGDARRIVPGVPLILQSDADYAEHARTLKASAFLHKKDIESIGPVLFTTLFKPKILNELP